MIGGVGQTIGLPQSRKNNVGETIGLPQNKDIMELPKRKPNRLKQYDYSQPGAYFVTICTDKRRCLLGDVAAVGETIGLPSHVKLSVYGKTADDAINKICECYPTVTVDKYVIMPNHIHLLLQLHADDGRAMLAPTVSTIIAQMKGYVTKRTGVSIWQKSFHDHVVRDEKDYLEIWEYIDGNPAKWEEDCFYSE